MAEPITQRPEKKTAPTKYKKVFDFLWCGKNELTSLILKYRK